MQRFLQAAEKRLNPGGNLVLVVMGKRTCWDRFYLFLKGKRKEMNRRNSREGIEVPLADGTVTTWYYSPKELIQMAGSNFTPQHVKPIGLFVPPSYLAPLCTRRKVFFRFLKFMDRWTRIGSFANFSDHYYLRLEKN
jgi:hypothetical protein